MSAPDEPLERRACPSCGEPAITPGQRFCGACGTELRPRAPVAPAAPEDPLGDVEARFRSLARLPELPDLLRTIPEVPELRGGALMAILSLSVLAVLGLFLTALSLFLCPPLALLPLALTGFGVYALARDLRWSARTPLEARAALAVEARTRLQAGAEHSPAHARRYVTLQFEDGARAEYECFASLDPAPQRGRMGVAYLKGDRLVAFSMLPI